MVSMPPGQATCVAAHAAVNLPGMPQAADISVPKLALVLIRASRSLAEFLEAGLAREGIHTTDFSILEALLHKGPLATSAIEQKLHLATAPLKVALDRLRRRGMVRGQDHRESFHASWFELTEGGRTTISRIYARHTEDIEAVMGVLSPGERRPLWEALKKIGIQGERCQHARSKDRRGGLAPWQLRRATEFMTEHLSGSVLLKDLAGQTGLSPSRFGRAFKLSMGVSPHRWQMNLRVLEAQEMLRDGKRSQADIALATGFAEQSHFSRVFKEVVGVPPGAWQRAHRQ
jgi:AraC-like DNA-binding protein/DNA-binding MarR family transcriptional regulator